MQCRGVDGLRGGFRQVARVADDACQHDAGGLVVDGDALFLIHLVDDGVGGANHLAAHKGDAAVCNVALHMVVYLLQDNGFAGTLHALRIVGVVGQDEPCLRHHARLQFGQREAEHVGDIGRLAVHPARHLGLAVVAHQPHQPGIRQGRGDGIHIGCLVTIDEACVRAPVQCFQQCAELRFMAGLRNHRIVIVRTGCPYKEAACQGGSHHPLHDFSQIQTYCCHIFPCLNVSTAAKIVQIE